MPRGIIIAGGGLAGLTLGILLRREGIPVEIWDAAGYPRHKVCGEFISGSGIDLLHGLGLSENPRWQTHCAETIRLFSNGSATRIGKLPRPALSISRWHLDDLLAREFVTRGGILREKSRWVDSFEKEGVVRATGRRATHGPGLIGLKVHARNLPLDADLELHFSAQGYVGLSRLPDGEVNICGLFQGAKLPNARENYRSIIRQVLSVERQESLARAEIDPDSFCAVAGISLEREPARSSAECRIGDSISLIPPLTGNGMSLAIESAYVAFSSLLEYACARITWAKASRRISQECDNRFRFRLAAASLLQKAAFHKMGRRLMLSSLRTVPKLLNCCFFGTR